MVLVYLVVQSSTRAIYFLEKDAYENGDIVGKVSAPCGLCQEPLCFEFPFFPKGQSSHFVSPAVFLTPRKIDRVVISPKQLGRKERWATTWPNMVRKGLAHQAKPPIRVKLRIKTLNSLIFPWDG